MNSGRYSSARPASLFNFEQLWCKSVHPNQLPLGSVALEALKPLEQELERKGIVKIDPANAQHPLWFIAETERNVFLWRNGLSLECAPEIDFWVDVESLIKKRAQQLTRSEPDNPFVGLMEDQATTQVGKYLEDYLGAFSKIAREAHCLSLAARRLLAEIGQEERPLILLPGR